MVSGVGAAQPAVQAAKPGAVVCLADGSYGDLRVSAAKSGDVVIRAEHPGATTLARATMSGSHLILKGFVITGGVTLPAGSDHMTVESNLITGGGQGIDAGNSSTVQISDVTIRGNKLVGQFGEDAIHANRYHDSDGDGYGLLVESNEITDVRETGNHNDAFQSVWVGDHLVFRHNFLHDNSGQGFFVKDQATAIDSVVVDDNLIIRNAAGCIPASVCADFALSPLQVYGPITNFAMTRNTIWTPELAPPTTLRGTGWNHIEVTDNVIHRAWTDADLSDMRQSGNVVCAWEAAPPLGALPALAAPTDCSPAFIAPERDDYRLRGGAAGVTWRPEDQHYGP